MLNPSHNSAFQSPHNEEAPDFLERNKFDVPSIFVIDLEARFSGDAMLVGEDSSGFFGLRKRELDDLTQAQKSQIQKMKVDWAVMKYPPTRELGQQEKASSEFGRCCQFWKALC